MTGHKFKGSIVLNPAGSAPTSPSEGQMYFSSVDKNLYVYSDGQWNIVGESDQLVKYTQNFNATTSVVVTHNLGSKPSVQVYNSYGVVILPDTITHDSLDQCTVTFGVSETGTILCIAGVNVTGGGVYATQYTQNFTNQTSLVVTHNLGYRPIIQIYDSSNEVLIPTSITHDTINQSTVTFDVSQSGTANCLVGGMNNIVASGNADTVDGLHAYPSTSPTAGGLLALDSSGDLDINTGKFKGDGSLLSNLPAPGVTYQTAEASNSVVITSTSSLLMEDMTLTVEEEGTYLVIFSAYISTTEAAGLTAFTNIIMRKQTATIWDANVGLDTNVSTNDPLCYNMVNITKVETFALNDVLDIYWKKALGDSSTVTYRTLTILKLG